VNYEKKYYLCKKNIDSMNTKYLFALVVSLFVSVSAFADGVIEPRKVENVTIKDLYGNPTKLPHYGEKNLLIFYVDPDAYLAMNKNNKFAEELEKNARAAGPEIYGFGILNFPDTWLPKEFLRKICRKRVENNGAIIIEDPDHSFKKGGGFGRLQQEVYAPYRYEGGQPRIYTS
jgi:hypothetical protein